MGKTFSSSPILKSITTGPFMAMAFLTLPPIPELRITDRGVIDAIKFKVVPLFCGPSGK